MMIPCNLDEVEEIGVKDYQFCFEIDNVWGSCILLDVLMAYVFHLYVMEVAIRW